MWIKVRKNIINLGPSAVIRQEGNTIRLTLDDEIRKQRIAEYVNPERAEEVMQGFWNTLKIGRSCYEFPEV